MLWIKEWKKDVKELEAQVCDIKKRLGQNWLWYPVEYITIKDYRGVERQVRKHTPEKDQNELLRLRNNLTHFYNYRAAHRNKVHVVNLPKYYKPDLSKYDKLKAQEQELRDQGFKDSTTALESILKGLEQSANGEVCTLTAD